MTSKNEEQVIVDVSEFVTESLNTGKSIGNIDYLKDENKIRVSFLDPNHKGKGCQSRFRDFPFTPPAPEFEAGIYGFVTYDDGSMLSDVWRIIRISGDFYVCRFNGNEAHVKHDNFTPLPIYAQLEQTKKALELACEHMSETDDKYDTCDDCPAESEHCGLACPVHLISHFLKEACDGKE